VCAAMCACFIAEAPLTGGLRPSKGCACSYVHNTVHQRMHVGPWMHRRARWLRERETRRARANACVCASSSTWRERRRQYNDPRRGSKLRGRSDNRFGLEALHASASKSPAIGVESRNRCAEARDVVEFSLPLWRSLRKEILLPVAQKPASTMAARTMNRHSRVASRKAAMPRYSKFKAIRNERFHNVYNFSPS